MLYALLQAWQRFGYGAIRRGGGVLGADIQVATGTQRAPLRLIAKVAGAAALLAAFTATTSAQSGSNFLNSVDPLFAGVLARPANLDNTIQYAAAAAAQGDIESAISAYEQLRFYNPKLGATRYQLAVLYYQLGSYAQARGYLQTALQMPDEAMRLVLGGDADAADAGIERIGEGEIDDARLAAEMHRRLGPPIRELEQPGAAAAGEHIRHRRTCKRCA